MAERSLEQLVQAVLAELGHAPGGNGQHGAADRPAPVPPPPARTWSGGGLDVAVLGAGHGGQAVAGHLSMNGHRVRLFSFFERELQGVRERGAIKLSGDVQGEAAPALVTNAIDEAVRGAQVVFIVAPAISHRTLAALLAACLEPGQIVVLNPGRTGGALEFAGALRRYSTRVPRVHVAEAQTFVYLVETREPGHVEILKQKHVVRVAALPASDNPEVVPVLQRLYPQFEAAESVLETSLNNVDGILHPTPMILNTAALERAAAGEDIGFYRHVVNPTVRELFLEKLDAERVAVAKAFGLDAWRVVDWFRESYGVVGATLNEAIENHPWYQRAAAPRGILQYHLILDAVPNSMVPTVALARAVGVPTPMTEAIIQLACQICEIDFWSEGRTLDVLGLAGLDPEAMKRFCATGEAQTSEQEECRLCYWQPRRRELVPERLLAASSLT